jgi:hypothetical protein
MVGENKVQCHHVLHASFYEGDVLKIVSLLHIFQLMNLTSLVVSTRFLELAMWTKCYRFRLNSCTLSFLSLSCHDHHDIYISFSWEFWGRIFSWPIQYLLCNKLDFMRALKYKTNIFCKSIFLLIFASSTFWYNTSMNFHL